MPAHRQGVAGFCSAVVILETVPWGENRELRLNIWWSKRRFYIHLIRTDADAESVRADGARDSNEHFGTAYPEGMGPTSLGTVGAQRRVRLTAHRSGNPRVLRAP
jgi:hypothetical protein